MTFGSRMQIINLYGRSFCGRPSSLTEALTRKTGRPQRTARTG